MAESPVPSRIASALSALDDAQLRARKAEELLSSLSPEAAVQEIAALLRAEGPGRRARKAATEAVLRALNGGRTPSLRESLRRAAELLGEDEVKGFVTDDAPVRAFDHGERGYVDREMASITLGRRRSLSRSPDRDVLARLAHDQDPTVVRQLCENPRVTEREVLLAASRRPTQGAVLEEIGRSRRWGQNLRVRKALALNPYSPPALAVAALSLLTAPALREVVRDRHVAPEVRLQARRFLARREGGEE